MIHAIRKLAREIHRRSVWQVLGVYVLLAWALVSAVEWLTDHVGLPSWTPMMTIVLVAVLLPLIVATAVVQEGLPGLRIEDEVDPNELEGLTPEQVHVIPEMHPLFHVGVLTWRNTVLGAVAAAALLVASVIAYLTMWALGIGPVGSLIAQGVITAHDPVIVAEFSNLTVDPSLGAVVTDLFELDLEECAVVTLADAGLAAEELTRLRQGGVAPASSTTALELAAREGIPLVVDGEVARRGSGYVVTARIVSVSAGAALARFDETASGDDELPAAIERLSEGIRQKMGESLRVIRQGRGPARLTTDSEEALRLYGLGGRAAAGGDHVAALQLLERAIRVDPGFALAWRKLAVVHDQVADTTAALDAYRRVLALWTDHFEGRPRTLLRLRERIADLEG